MLSLNPFNHSLIHLISGKPFHHIITAPFCICSSVSPAKSLTKLHELLILQSVVHNLALKIQAIMDYIILLLTIPKCTPPDLKLSQMRKSFCPAAREINGILRGWTTFTFSLNSRTRGGKVLMDRCSLAAESRFFVEKAADFLCTHTHRSSFSIPSISFPGCLTRICSYLHI